MPYYNFKCPNCGKQFYVDSSFKHKHDLTFTCDSCGKEIDINFFDKCPACNQYAGFYNNWGLSDTLNAFVGGYVNPLKGISSLIGSLINTSNAGIGICRMCGKKFVRCPKCGTLTSIPLKTNAEDTFICSGCQTELTTNVKYVDDGVVDFVDDNEVETNSSSFDFVSFYNEFFEDIDDFTSTNRKDLEEELQTMMKEAENADSTDRAKVSYLMAFACLCYIEKTNDTSHIKDDMEFATWAYQKSPCDETKAMVNIFTLLDLATRTYSNKELFLEGFRIFNSIPATTNISINDDSTLIKVEYLENEYQENRYLAVWQLLTLDPIQLIDYDTVIELTNILLKSSNKKSNVIGWYIRANYHGDESDEIRYFTRTINYLKELYPAYIDESKQDWGYILYCSAIATLGCDYLLFDKNKDVNKGLAMIHESIDKYDSTAGYCALGKVYLMGLGGLAIDNTLALEYFSKAAQRKDGYGTYFLGFMCEKGLIEGEGVDEAIKWYQVASERKGYQGYFYGEDLPTAEEKVEELKKKTVQSVSPVSSSRISKEEQEYLSDLKDFLGDGELSPREQKMLDRMRQSLGISEQRAKELEAMLNTQLLSEDEQEYKDMYDEYMAKGSLTEKERHRLDKFATALNISDERKAEIEIQ